MRILRLLPVLGSLVLAGCSGDGSGSGAGDTISLHMEPFTVAGGEETTRCYAIHLGNDERIEFDRISSNMVDGSHHLILYRDASYLIPGNTPPEAGWTDCGMDTPRLYVYSAQEAVNETTFPEGVGGDMDPNAIFIVEVHYANASPDPVEAFADITFHRAKEGAIEQLAGILFYLNADFAIPPGAGFDGTPEHVDGVSCDVPETVNVFRVRSHTHKRGIKVEGWIDGADRTRKIYKNEDWHAPAEHDFIPEPLVIAGGEDVRFECTWTNETDGTIDFGPSVEDEMCILGLGYYPRINGPYGLDGNVFCYDGEIYY